MQEQDTSNTLMRRKRRKLQVKLKYKNKLALKDEIKAEKGKKQLLEFSIDVLTKEADELAKQAEKKMKMDLLVKSNAFREKVKEKRREIEQVEEKIKRTDKNLQQI